METALLTKTYWRDAAPDLRLNPGVPHPGPGLSAVIAAEPRLRGHLLFATSGSSGRPKIVCIAKSAFLTAAAWTNRHLACGAEDCWLLALPTFHVGGLGVLARAWVAGGRLEVFQGRWNAAQFATQLKETGATVTSLVPTQLHDLVLSQAVCPSPLRVLVIGGGRLEPGLRSRAVALGWPVRESYGMTETSAQVATQLSADEPTGWLPLIPEWQVRIQEGQVWLRGAPLLTAYLEAAEGAEDWGWRTPFDENGWFGTGDVGELDGEGRLRVLGRAGRVVKILGELVDLERLDLVLAAICPEGDSLLEPVEDARAGWRLRLVTERAGAAAEAVADRFNEQVAAFEQIVEVRNVERLRRSPLGKRLPQGAPDSKA